MNDEKLFTFHNLDELYIDLLHTFSDDFCRSMSTRALNVEIAGHNDPKFLRNRMLGKTIRICSMTIVEDSDRAFNMELQSDGSCKVEVYKSYTMKENGRDATLNDKIAEYTCRSFASYKGELVLFTDDNWNDDIPIDDYLRPFP